MNRLVGGQRDVRVERYHKATSDFTSIGLTGNWKVESGVTVPSGCGVGSGVDVPLREPDVSPLINWSTHLAHTGLNQPIRAQQQQETTHGSEKESLFVCVCVWVCVCV